MDGDSIGGSVNLVMKQAPEKLKLFGTVGGGYNSLLSDWGQGNYSMTAGRRFNGGQTGVIFSLSGSETNRGNMDMEVVYTPTLALNELNPRWYQVHRGRIGFTGAVRFQAGQRRQPVPSAPCSTASSTITRTGSGCAGRSPTGASIASCAIARTSSASPR